MSLPNYSNILNSGPAYTGSSALNVQNSIPSITTTDYSKYYTNTTVQPTYAPALQYSSGVDIGQITAGTPYEYKANPLITFQNPVESVSDNSGSYESDDPLSNIFGAAGGLLTTAVKLPGSVVKTVTNIPKGIPGLPGKIPGLPGDLSNLPGGILKTVTDLPKNIPQIPGLPGGIPGLPGGIPGLPGGIPGLPSGNSNPSSPENPFSPSGSDNSSNSGNSGGDSSNSSGSSSGSSGKSSFFSTFIKYVLIFILVIILGYVGYYVFNNRTTLQNKYIKPKI